MQHSALKIKLGSTQYIYISYYKWALNKLTFLYSVQYFILVSKDLPSLLSDIKTGPNRRFQLLSVFIFVLYIWPISFVSLSMKFSISKKFITTTFSITSLYTLHNMYIIDTFYKADFFLETKVILSISVICVWIISPSFHSLAFMWPAP